MWDGKCRYIGVALTKEFSNRKKMKIKPLYLLFLFLIFTQRVIAQTNVSGIISTNTTWTLAGSPYNIVADIGIPLTVKLTVEPGVTINYNGDYQILILGSIEANGTSNQKINLIKNSLSINPPKALILFRNSNLNLSLIRNVNISSNANSIYAQPIGLRIGDETEQNQSALKNSGSLNVIKTLFNKTKLYANGYQSTAQIVSDSCTFVNTEIKGTYPLSERIYIKNGTLDSMQINSDAYNLGIYLISSQIKSSTLLIGCCGGNIQISKCRLEKCNINEGMGSPVSGPLIIKKSILLNTGINLPAAEVILDSTNVFIKDIYLGTDAKIIAGNGKIRNSVFEGNGLNPAVKFTGNSGYNIGGVRKISKSSFQNYNDAIIFNGGSSNYVDSCNFLKVQSYFIRNLGIQNISANNNYWDSLSPIQVQAKIFDGADDLNYGVINILNPQSIPNKNFGLLPINQVMKKPALGGSVNISWENSNNTKRTSYKIYLLNSNLTPTLISTISKNVNSISVVGAINSNFAVSVVDSYSTGNNDQYEGHESWFASATEKPVVSSSTGIFIFCVGSQANLSTQSKSTYTYQWVKDSINIPGATSNTFIATTPGMYKVRITEFGQSFLSDGAPVMFDAIYTPVISTPNGNSTCFGNKVKLTTDSTNVLLQWYKDGVIIVGATAKSYNAIATGSYTVKSTKNFIGCVNFSAPQTVTINQYPNSIISYTSPISFCQGSNIKLSAAYVAGATYQWYKNGAAITDSIRQHFIATASGTYSLMTTLNGCGNISTPVIVNVVSVPSVEVSANKTISSNDIITSCVAESITLSVPNVPNNTYQWKLNSINISGAISSNLTFTPSVQGTFAYSVAVTNNNICTSTSKSIVVMANPLPIATISSTKSTICIGDSVNISTSNNTGNTYQWKRNDTLIVGATNSNYYAKKAGTYTLLVTNNNCIAVSNSKTILVSNYPDATMNPQGVTQFCLGGSVLLSANFNSGYTYQWRLNGVNILGATNYNYTATQTGQYSVIIANVANCFSTSIVSSVNVRPLPNATIINNGNLSVCLGDSIKLRANSESGLVYQWKKNNIIIPGATDSICFVKSAGNYSVAITNQNGCQNSSVSKAVTINSLPTVAINNLNSICVTSPPIALTGGHPTGGVYSGVGVSNGFFNPIVAGIGNKTIYYGYTNSNGCSNFTSSTIEVKPLPLSKIDTIGKVDFCKGSSVTLFITHQTGKTYQWFKNGILMSDTNNSLTANSTGLYYAKAMYNGCSSFSDTISVRELPLPIISINNITPLAICSGGSSTLKVNSNQTYTTQWLLNNNILPNAIDSIYNATLTGAYRAITQNQYGCSDTSNSINVIVFDYPVANLTAYSKTKICKGDSALLIINKGIGLTYQWFKDSSLILGAIDSVLYAKAAGNYYVDVTLNNLCKTSSQILKITTYPNPYSLIYSLNNNNQICFGDSLNLFAKIQNGMTCQWYHNDTLIVGAVDSIYLANKPGVYQVNVTDSIGCNNFSNELVVNYFNPPFSQEQICGITIDSASGRTIILWPKTLGVRTKTYNIYRENEMVAAFQKIGEVSFSSPSIFIDSTSNPVSKSYRYKLSVSDSCDLESGLSLNHKTIHLSSNIGTGNILYLAWSAYEGFPYTSQKIKRSNNGSPFFTIGNVSNLISYFTDSTPPSGINVYQIEVENNCINNLYLPNIKSILSNKLTITSSGVSNTLNNKIKIYPNPTNNIINIEGLNKNENNTIQIFDVQGKLVITKTIKEKGTIDLLELNKGVYVIKVGEAVKRIIKF